MQHVLKKTNGFGYVARPGHPKSYTTNLVYARKYSSKEAADADRCPENEIAIPLEQLLDACRN